MKLILDKDDEAGVYKRYEEWLEKERLKKATTLLDFFGQIEDWVGYNLTNKQARAFENIFEPPEPPPPKKPKFNFRRKMSLYTVHGLKSMYGRLRNLGGFKAWGQMGAIKRELNRRR